jgi:hypothetical protein
LPVHTVALESKAQCATIRRLIRGSPKGKGGRPSRAEASAKALLGVDLAALDPVAVLREIMGDRSQPGSTRVAAARTLLGVRDEDPAEDSAAAAGDVAERAIRLMAAARKAH